MGKEKKSKHFTIDENNIEIFADTNPNTDTDNEDKVDVKNMQVYNVVYTETVKHIVGNFGYLEVFIDTVYKEFCTTSEDYLTLNFLDTNISKGIIPINPKLQMILLLSKPHSLESIAKALLEIDNNGNPNFEALIPLKKECRSEMLDLIDERKKAIPHKHSLSYDYGRLINKNRIDIDK